MKFYGFRSWFVIVLIFGLTAVVFSGLTGMGSAAEPTSVGNMVTGQINAISKSLNFISLEYKFDKATGTSFQMALPITGSPPLIGFQSLKDLKVGDTVTVAYSDVTDFDANNHEIHKRVVTSIKFISSASAGSALSSG